jgi:hypothetical protein
MAEFHVGVVRIDGEWRIISAGLRTGAYATRDEAERAARRLADHSAPAVSLHIQTEDGELQQPETID